MQVLVCDGQWSVTSGSPTCTGTLLAVQAHQLPGNGMTTEDALELHGQTLVLFAIVFGYLAIKKVLNIK